MDIMLQRLIELMGNRHGSAKALADSIGVPANLISDGGRSKTPRKCEYGVRLLVPFRPKSPPPKEDELAD